MYAEIIVNTNDIETATAVIPFMPVPIQIIMIGARAVLGKAFNTTKNGSIILAIILFHQRIIAISKPARVPITNPNIVSSNDMPICLYIVFVTI